MALIADSWRKAGEVLFTQPQSIIKKEVTISDSHHPFLFKRRNPNTATPESDSLF